VPDTGPSTRTRVRMTARPIDEPHRVASQLELLFDLTFVVAIAAVTAQLAHSIADGHALDSLVPFLQVFFAIWWAWMNFTWFASAYDTDDVAYRLLTMLQMAGVLVLAAGVPAAADDADFRAVTLGYLIMRIGLVAQWVRAGVEDPASRRTAFRYAAGLTVLQVGWAIHLLLTETEVLRSTTEPVVFAVLVVLELAVPRWAERAGATTWHPHHIAERYGLFTIILLGESVLATTRAVQGVVESSDVSASLVTVAVCGLVLLFSLWWLYFLHPAGPGLANRRHRSYRWGYGHYGIFGALAALGAGLEVAVEQTGHHLRASPTTVSYAVAIPVSVFLILLWTVHALIAAKPITRPATIVGCTGVILLLPLTTRWTSTAAVIAAITGVCVLLTVVIIASQRRTDNPGH
jgi:low temperature requirement protein LtrA